MTNQLTPRRKQILYRAQHRGFKEADLLLGGFAAENIAHLSESELDDFEVLLQNDDRDLYDWIIEKRFAPEEFQTPVFKKIQGFDVVKLLGLRG